MKRRITWSYLVRQLQLLVTCSRLPQLSEVFEEHQRNIRMGRKGPRQSIALR